MSDNIIQVNQEIIHTELKDLVRTSVEEALNAMLDAEADKLINAERYARNEERKGYRSGHYERSFTTTSGEINIKMPKLKGLTFETSIIERYKRRETSVEEALIEMYLAGVSVRRVEDISEALWGTKVSPGTISNLNRKVLWSSFFVTLVAKKIVLINLCCRPCFIWGSITIITVWTNMIIINVCKFFYLLIECFLCCKLIQICAFILQGIEITLHRCIVVRISCFAHALCHIYRFAEFGKCFGRIL